MNLHTLKARVWSLFVPYGEVDEVPFVKVVDEATLLK